MAHFSSANSFNMYRLPIAWQYLTNNVLGGTLDATNLAKYDALVQACLTTGSHCIIDIHNYARWNDGIIGQGGPTNDQFASVWSQLAKKYATESKVIMGIMNEPHDSESEPLYYVLLFLTLPSPRYQRLGRLCPSCCHSHPYRRSYLPNLSPSWKRLHIGWNLCIRRFRSSSI